MMGSSVLNMKRSHSNVQIRIYTVFKTTMLGSFLGCNLTIAPAPMDSHPGRKASAEREAQVFLYPHPNLFSVKNYYDSSFCLRTSRPRYLQDRFNLNQVAGGWISTEIQLPEG